MALAVTPVKILALTEGMCTVKMVKEQVFVAETTLIHNVFRKMCVVNKT